MFADLICLATTHVIHLHMYLTLRLQLILIQNRMTDIDKFITPYLGRQHPEEITSVQEYSALGDQPGVSTLSIVIHRGA